MIWYFLEEYLSRSMVQIDNLKDVNLSMKSEPEVIFLVCRTDETDCKSTIKRYYDGFYESKENFYIKNEELPFDNQVFLFKKMKVFHYE